MSDYNEESTEMKDMEVLIAEADQEQIEAAQEVVDSQIFRWLKAIEEDLPDRDDKKLLAFSLGVRAALHEHFLQQSGGPNDGGEQAQEDNQRVREALGE